MLKILGIPPAALLVALLVAMGLMVSGAVWAGPALAGGHGGSGHHGGAHHGPWTGPPHLKPWHTDLYRRHVRPGWYRVCSYERGPASPYGAIAEAVEHGVAGGETGAVKATCSNGYWYGRTGGWYYPGYGQPLNPAFGWPVIGDPGDLGRLPQIDFYPD